MSDATNFPLPAMREDLQLLQGPVKYDGSPSWNIYDPIRNRYFKVGWQNAQMLLRWTTGNALDLLSRLKAETTCDASLDDIRNLVRSLQANNLTEQPASGNSADYLQQLNAHRRGRVKQFIHAYLFLRIPLVHPHHFLQATLPYLSPLFSARVRIIMLMLGMLGMYLAGRQWDDYSSTFMYFFSVEGALYFLVALIFIKILHELGHAYVATHYGCKVPTMGIAFLVMFPVLYTDTTDSWRLTSRKQRLHIGIAGVQTELYVAAISTLLWAFLPDGSLRSIVFFLSSTSWILSLGVNLNIFLRFDGYYILSDWLGIENLQSRSIALGKWRLRKILFALDDPPPELFPHSMQRLLILYAWGTWLYRLFLFTLIAVLVYYLFFKVLGILLFALEVGWFIVMPIVNELKVWWSRRVDIIESPRFPWFAGSLLLLLLIVFIPWSSRVEVPAIMRSEAITTIHAPYPGYITRVNLAEHREIYAGDTILQMESPALQSEIAQTQIKLEEVLYKLSRHAANPLDRANLIILEQQERKYRSQLSGLLQKQEQLTVRSPVSGEITDIADNLHNGRWINEQLSLLTIVDQEQMIVEGLIAEIHLGQIQSGFKARFIPDNIQLPGLQLSLADIGSANVQQLDINYLASVYGGEVAVTQDPHSSGLIPEQSVYRLWFQLEEQDYIPQRVTRGVVHIEGHRRSLFSRMFTRVAAVLVRESGF